jgi:hypothetical protein
VALGLETDKLLLSLSQVNGRLPTEDALQGLTALKECGVMDVAFPLKATPEKVTLTAGTERRTSFIVAGGTPPYVARLQVTPVDGVNVVSPPPYESTVGIEITAKASPQSVPVVVMDSAKPSKILVVVLEIAPAESKAAEDATRGGITTKPDQITDSEGLAHAINETKLFKMSDKTELSVRTPAKKQSETEVSVGLHCKPTPQTCFAATAAADVIIKAINAPPEFGKRLKPKGAADCICSTTLDNDH